jgi:phage-related baseplate assembly protein
MPTLTKPEFIDRDAAAIVAEMKAYYEAETGRILRPAQPEMLLINMFAYREALLRTALNEAALSNLVEFSIFPVIDYLGQLVGVTRLAPSKAVTTIRFQLVTGHGGVTVPAGTRVATLDGSIVFTTLQNGVAAPSDTFVDVPSEAIGEGSNSNAFAPGSLTSILDPKPFISSATNTETTGGGAEQETDEALRERIRLAPAAFSNAGSRGAYEFHAKSASPAIIDVAITNPVPGTVEIFPLISGGGETPSDVLAAVAAACNDEKVRPLTDTVLVTSPTKIEYTLEVELVLYATAVEEDVVAAVVKSLEDFTVDKRLRLGRDIVGSQIVAAASIDGEVYSVTLVGFSDVEVGPSEYAFCTDISVTVTDTTNG